MQQIQVHIRKINFLNTLKLRQMSAKMSQITGNSTVCQNVPQVNTTGSSSLLAICNENPTATGGFPHKEPVMRKTFPYHVLSKHSDDNEKQYHIPNSTVHEPIQKSFGSFDITQNDL